VKVKTIVGAHSPRILTFEEFESALDPETRVALQ
jgi:ABC-type polar amino acid transport system ATPase subunit